MASDQYTQPSAYGGGIPPSLYGADYAELLRRGLPLTVVRSILTRPSYDESATKSPGKWADYRGWQDEAAAAQGTPWQKLFGDLPAPRSQDLWQKLSDADWQRYWNLPREEQSIEGLGQLPNDLMRLPSGQYFPMQVSPQMLQLLQYYLGFQPLSAGSGSAGNGGGP